MAEKNIFPEAKEYIDALERYEAQPQGSPNHSEDCSFESFKSATDCIVDAISSRKSL